MAVFDGVIPAIVGAANAAGGGYEIERSVRFNSADNAHLDRTPSSAGNRRTWTWSGWVKRTALGADKFIFSAGSDPSNFHYLRFQSNNTLEATEKISDSVQSSLITSAVFRDPSAWYHIIYVYDSTQAIAADRLSLYVNGVKITSFSTSTYPSQNHDSYINSTSNHIINGRPPATYSDFYLAEIHSLDGTAVSDASDFGEYDDNNVWQPKEVSGVTYGTNGYYLDFSDNSSSAALGTDSSGNGNTWTVNNISVASGAGNDSLIDTPTNYDDGTNVGGNYATLNPLDKSSSLTVSNGNLEADTTGGWDSVRATFGMSSGKWYWETQNKQTAGALVGIAEISAPHGTLGVSPNIPAWTWAGANVYINGTSSGTGLSNHSSTDIVQYALDVDAGKLWFGRNGTWYDSSWGTTGNPSTGANPTVSGLSTTSTYFAAAALIGAGAIYNFGARSFSYTPPTGFKSLCTTNLPDPTIADGSTAMNVALYDGNNSTNAITGLGFSPDMLWLKSRSSGTFPAIANTVVGPNYFLRTNDTAAESGPGFSDDIVSFDSDGFTLGADTYYAFCNRSPNTYVAWTWDGGSSTVSNTDGSITSSVRANASVGFSIVSWTGTANAGTIGHGLNAAPKFIIAKNRDAADAWYCYHSALGNGARIQLNETSAQTTGSSQWNSTSPTNSVFSVGAGSWQAIGEDLITYCFAPVDGYSAFGSYTGNGSTDGPFVFTGFRPRWILIKRYDGGANGWGIFDTLRPGYNLTDSFLQAQSGAAESTGATAYAIDILSNGFKVKGTDAFVNQSGGSYIYAAFAEHPFKTARAR